MQPIHNGNDRPKDFSIDNSEITQRVKIICKQYELFFQAKNMYDEDICQIQMQLKFGQDKQNSLFVLIDNEKTSHEDVPSLLMHFKKIKTQQNWQQKISVKIYQTNLRNQRFVLVRLKVNLQQQIFKLAEIKASQFYNDQCCQYENSHMNKFHSKVLKIESSILDEESVTQKLNKEIYIKFDDQRMKQQLQNQQKIKEIEKLKSKIRAKQKQNQINQRKQTQMCFFEQKNKYYPAKYIKKAKDNYVQYDYQIQTIKESISKLQKQEQINNCRKYQIQRQGKLNILKQQYSYNNLQSQLARQNSKLAQIEQINLQKKKVYIKIAKKMLLIVFIMVFLFFILPGIQRLRNWTNLQSKFEDMTFRQNLIEKNTTKLIKNQVLFTQLQEQYNQQQQQQVTKADLQLFQIKDFNNHNAEATMNQSKILMAYLNQTITLQIYDSRQRRVNKAVLSPSKDNCYITIADIIPSEDIVLDLICGSLMQKKIVLSNWAKYLSSCYIMYLFKGEQRKILKQFGQQQIRFQEQKETNIKIQ